MKNFKMKYRMKTLAPLMVFFATIPVFASKPVEIQTGKTTCVAYCGVLIQTGVISKWVYDQGYWLDGHTEKIPQYSSDGIQSSQIIVGTDSTLEGALLALSKQCDVNGLILYTTLVDGKPVPANNPLDMCRSN